MELDSPFCCHCSHCEGGELWAGKKKGPRPLPSLLLKA